MGPCNRWSEPEGVAGWWWCTSTSRPYDTTPPFATRLPAHPIVPSIPTIPYPAPARSRYPLVSYPLELPPPSRGLGTVVGS